MKIGYRQINFKPRTLWVIECANTIIDSYQAQGLTLTLRQLYYQFVSADLIPNNIREYSKLGDIINDGRMAGLIDWHAIEDRGRRLNTHLAFRDVKHRLTSAANSMALNPWETQDNYVEVWVEKEALIGVIERACDPLRVPYFACKGYNSASAAFEAGQRMRAQIANGKKVHLLHLGDHDPSGIDMTRDNRMRLEEFIWSDDDSGDLTRVDRDYFQVHRLALNMDQVRAYKPPPNPAKETDTRAEPYIKRYGHSSWELDALKPEVLRTLIQKSVLELVDDKAWKKFEKEEKAAIKEIKKLSDQY